MRARARIEFGIEEQEFWEMTREDWNDHCHVADRMTVMLDKQFAEVRHMLYSTFRNKESPDLDVRSFRLLQDPEQPDEISFFDAMKSMII